jgi:hypothetical protein
MANATSPPPQEGKVLVLNESYRVVVLDRDTGEPLIVIEYGNERNRGRKETVIQARFIESFQDASRPGWDDGDKGPTCKKKKKIDRRTR